MIVWEKCQNFGLDCDIWQATRTSSGWTAMQLTDTAADERHPATDGRIVAYNSARGMSPDIFWRPFGGGAEHHLALPSLQQNPSISDNLIVFEHYDATASIPSFDVPALRPRHRQRVPAHAGFG